MRSPASGLALLVAVALLGCGSATGQGAQNAGELPDVSGPWSERGDLPRVQVPLEGSAGRGASHPLVTMVVFSDFQCSYCRDAASVIDRLLARHPDSLRVHFRHLPLPFHEHAQLAAEAAEEARRQRGDEGFWAFHDRLFQSPDALAEDDLLGHAEALGFDVERFRIALRGRVHERRIERDLDLADQVGAEGTPTFYLNGRPLLGLLPENELEALLTEEIDLSREALGRGIPRALIYAAAMREALHEPPAREPEPAVEPRGGGARRLDREALYAVPVTGAPQRGPSDALVTVVVFSDFQCPFCARANPTLDALMERYPQQIRIVFRHNPLDFHRDGLPAAAAAMEAHAQQGDDGFWRMHDLLFEDPRALHRDDLLRYAGQLGLDVDRFRAALDEGLHEEAVEADQALARRLGARSTPTFYVNGRLIQGAQPLPVFVDAVDDALERAQSALSSGAPRAAIYEALLRQASPEAVYREDEPEEEDVRAVLPVPASAPRRGAEDPALVVQVFSDFQCPFCGSVGPTVDRLLREHPQVQLVFRHYPLPFHDDARPAAIASVEVQRQLGDAGFWAFHDRLFENQRSLGRAALVAHAAAVGADPERVGAAIDEATHEAVVQADMDAVRRAGLRIGTPAFLIGDRLLMGAQPYPVFERAVRAALEDAAPAADAP